MLEGELAAYSPLELAEFVETVGILLDAADDGSLTYFAAHARIRSALARAVEKRIKAESSAGRTANVIPFRGRGR